ncbi:type I-E CRISPR-associated protein Cas6/Cse3/CasE [Streptomyces olivoreticuli]|uniref:type I-E CRISPR-associated protein Cas6/Cse3/CasE n=1 Tax=Streptomyces olivoreticuli TaxID=68246 RepID=UPI0013C29FF9|nr:type I-E CRISPR-associated protein Cas6/Cse3/CasE [Streptomyces olivoreticuli]
MTGSLASTVPLYLARLQLNTADRQVQRDLRYAHELHKTVMSLFPEALGETPRASAGILFRLEPGRSGPVMLVQSAIPAHLDNLPVGYTTAADQRSLSPVLEWIDTGIDVRYRIVAHPLVARCVPGRRRSTTVSLEGEEAADWWIRKAESAGLDLHGGGTGHPVPVITGRSIHHRPVHFDGTATITDPTALRTALLQGIGKGRAYGCGLLSLAPLPPRN